MSASLQRHSLAFGVIRHPAQGASVILKVSSSNILGRIGVSPSYLPMPISDERTSLTIEEARDLVRHQIHTPDPTGPDRPQHVIVDEHTIERPWGWVFFYNDRRYLETGSSKYVLFGNAPYIVNRFTGEVKVTGTAYPIEDYLAEYEASLREDTGWRWLTTLMRWLDRKAGEE